MRSPAKVEANESGQEEGLYLKKKLLQGVWIWMLAGVLAFVGVPVSGNSVRQVEAAGIKLVPKSDLDQVTGIKYSTTTGRLSWNKVSGATRYEVTVKDAKGTLQKSNPNLQDPYCDVNLGEGTFSVTIVAKDDTCYYVVASDVTDPDDDDLADTDYDEKVRGANGSYTLYKHPTSAPTVATIQVKLADISTKTVSKLSGIERKDKSESAAVFGLTGTVSLNRGERVEWQYSNNRNFRENSGRKLYTYKEWKSYNEPNKDLTIYYFQFDPGETVYVRARVYNSFYNYNTSTSEQYSAYTSVKKIRIPLADISNVGITATSHSVTLHAIVTDRTVTGYQFAKKVGNKWVTLTTQSDNVYVDTSLAKNASYQYRVRAYTYNQNTKKTTWTDWSYTKAATWGSNPDLRASAAGATSVKLTWKPVTGAEGYEIYRRETSSSFISSSNSRKVSKGVGVEAAALDTLVKTIDTPKTKSFTDKNLVKSGSYTYTFRAFKTIGEQKVYLEDEAYISLKPGNLSGVTRYVTAAGKTVVKWNKMTGIKGYYVEKYNASTDRYTRVKTLKASATSYTFGKLSVGSDEVRYQIRPYDASTIYSGTAVTVTPTLAAPKKVRAQKTANGVKITWSKVSGADYYRVYRTTSNEFTYNRTTKTYDYYGSYNLEPVYEGEVNTLNCRPELGENPYNEVGTYAITDICATSVEDKALVYQEASIGDDGKPVKVGTSASGQPIYQTEEAFYRNIEGPEAGNTYYYFVIAYAKDSNGKVDSGVISSASTKAAAITYTNKVATKVSKITSVKSDKPGEVTVTYQKVGKDRLL